ncbi:MAG TPA: hypothetical protein VFI31_06600 [Pirellulales bacterium]|nr:hypothetical protein [Pirellulales bacterium]
MATVESSTFKSRLLRKAHALLGTSRIERQLAQISEGLRSLQATTRSLPAAANERPGPDEESLRRLESQGLFILGAARSGTTILTRCLNRGREIMLLEEPSFYLNAHTTDFVGYFNELHASMGNRPMKGTYLAPPLMPEPGPLATLLRLGRDYRFVGEKAAVGPHDYPPEWPRRYLDFQAKYFLRAKYVCIARTPVESIWSMHKLFPDRPIPRLIEAWLRALALSLDAYNVFPEARLVFFDHLNDRMIERLGDWLDVAIPVTAGTFGRNYIRSAVRQGEIPGVLRPFTGVLRKCTDVYDELRENFSPDEHVYSSSVSEWHYFAATHRQIETLLERLASEDARELPSEDARGCQIRLAA